MTQTVTLYEGRAFVFVAVENANSEIICIYAARSANRFEAVERFCHGEHRCLSFIAFFFQAEDGIRDPLVTGVQTCALPISSSNPRGRWLSRVPREQPGAERG